MLKSTGAATFNPRPKRIEVVGARIMNLPGILHLILERDPFDRIAKGTKRTEYREYTPVLASFATPAPHEEHRK